MTLSEREKEILDLCNEDSSNEQIYIKLEELIFDFLSTNKAGNNERDREEIAQTMAADIYMRMYKGEKFQFLLSFINRIYKRYVFNMYKYYETLNITPSEYEEAMTAIGRTDYFEPAVRAVESVYLEDIGLVIEDIIRSSCAYNLQSYIAENMRISLALSILRGYTVEFHLTKEQSEQLPLLITAFRNKIRTDLKGRCL